MARLTPGQKANAPRNVANLWAFDVDKIHIEPGFNVRQEGPDLDAHIRWLANEFKRVGFDQTQPLAVIRHPDQYGHAIIRKGHCRFRGVLLAISEGAKIQSVPCLIEPKGTNAVLQTYQFGTSNSGKPLGYLDYAVAVMRLRAWGEEDEQIIAGYGKSKEWLNSVLELNESDPEIHRIVKAGQMAQTGALRMVRRHGSNAPAKVKEAVTHAKERGKERATGRDIIAVDRPRTEPPSLASLVAAAVNAWESGADLNGTMATLRDHPLVVALRGQRKAA